MEQRAKQLMCWFEPFVKLRAPKMFNLRRDPFERADENSNTYWDWVISHAYLLYGMQAVVAQQIEAFTQVPAAAEAGVVQSGRGAAADPGRLGQRQPLDSPQLSACGVDERRPGRAASADVTNTSQFGCVNHFTALSRALRQIVSAGRKGKADAVRCNCAFIQRCTRRYGSEAGRYPASATVAFVDRCMDAPSRSADRAGPLLARPHRRVGGFPEGFT